MIVCLRRLSHGSLLAPLASAVLVVPSVAAQDAAAPVVLPGVTVTATRVERESFDLPVSIDTVTATTIQQDRPMVNLSESLNAVPGIVVQNRQNYAQDLQISSRGFGARSSFGVRGLRLIADGIPATMPDGQGQAASFSLDSAERIEVLRGPFSAMYGNAAGGVIQIFTADGPPQPTLTGRVEVGSYDTTKYMLGFGGQYGRLNANAVTSAFRTDGYRDHSAASRDHTHGKFKLDAGSSGTFTLVADIFDQPDTQDPLGLTAAQVAQNRRQPGTNALAFNTRKSVWQNQLGLIHDFRLGAHDSLQARGYAGERQLTQYLAIPLAAQGAPTSAGGVVNLDRDFGGGGIRWAHEGQLGGMPFDTQVGIDLERMAERRRGFINSFGTAGALKRNEDDTVRSTDVYAQAEWHPWERLLVMAGVRHSRVEFDSKDYFVAAGNPDDSGSTRYVRTSPAAGMTFDVNTRVKVYANAGKGFETPTFAELAYRTDGSPGLNFGLQPAVSTHYETGVKVKTNEKSRATAAIYRIDVSNEIVVASNIGGRTTFKNASHTRREGVELGWQGELGAGFESAVAYTHLYARFTDPFTSGTPPVTVRAGSRMPGVPEDTLYGELIWRHRPSGFHAAAEVRHNSKVFVDDQNSAAAGAYTVANLRMGLEQRTRQWRFTEFVRVDNVTDRQYIGSVIVAAGSGQFYEPAPGRNWLLGVSAQVTF